MFICSIMIAAMLGCSSTANVPEFDQNYAFEVLKKQVDIGPRYAGVPGHKETSDYIVSQVKPYADGVDIQQFTRETCGKTLNMNNIVAYFNPNAKKWILLAAHWDSRPTADMEIDPQKKKMPIPAADDGASGVAVLVELAKMFAKQKPDVGVFIVFFDGEDYGPGENNMYLGARYFAANKDTCAAVNGKPIKIDYGILLDMIGDSDLDIYQEEKSLDAAPDVVKKVWSTAAKLGYNDQFINRPKYAIDDDHIPLIRSGIKCIDLIDFDYAPWHTLDDTVDKCSPKSLKAVGDVVANVVYGEKQD